MSLPRRDEPDLLRGWRVLAAILGVSVVSGFLHFGYKYLDVLVRAGTEPVHMKLTEELTGSIGAGLLVPAIFWLARRVRGYGIVAVLTHVGAAFGLSAAHTTWNWATRELVFRLLGHGPYDYGIIRLRYLMELPNDLVWYSIFLTIAILFEHYRVSRDREVRLAELEAEMSKVRLQALEARLHPHFLFNALNTISAVMYENVDEADRVLSRLGEFLRRTLRDDGVAEVPLREELETLELYLDIVRARFGDRLQVTVDADGDTKDAAIPPLVLQPLVENAIKHGDPGPGVDARVTVSARRNNGSVMIEVEDNGPGLSGSVEQALSGGIGLSTTQRRLERLYGATATLVLLPSASGGLRVQLAIPFHRTDDS